MLRKGEEKYADQKSVDVCHPLPTPKLTERATAAYPVPRTNHCCPLGQQKLPLLQATSAAHGKAFQPISA